MGKLVTNCAITWESRQLIYALMQQERDEPSRN